MVAPRIVCLNCQKRVPRTYTICPFCSNDPRTVKRPVWEQYKPAERGVPWWLMARDTFHFNDGWGQARVELVNAMPGLYHMSIQHIQRFDDDPSGLERVVSETILGPAQVLALGEFISKHKTEIERETINETSNMGGE